MISNTKDVLVLRTDFSNDKKWTELCDLISQPSKDSGFKAYVECLSNKDFENLKDSQVSAILPESYSHYYIFLVDTLTLKHSEYPILCIELQTNSNNSFRVVPSELWSVENNLSISNMDFDDFKAATDADGIFRGFR